MTGKSLLAVASVLCFAGIASAQTKATPAAPAAQPPAAPAAKDPPKDAGKPPAKAETKNIVETAMGTGMHKTLCDLLKDADWVAPLSDAKEKFTVFAPTDDAFKKIDAKALEALRKDKKALGNVLTFHVIKGNVVMAKDVVTMKESVATVQGSKFNIVVKDGKVSIGNSKGMANVTKTDVVCSNGVIHVIDAVMMPEDAKKTETPAKAPEKKEEKKAPGK